MDTNEEVIELRNATVARCHFFKVATCSVAYLDLASAFISALVIFLQRVHPVCVGFGTSGRTSRPTNQDMSHSCAL